MPLNLQDELLRKQQATDAYLAGIKGESGQLAGNARTSIEAGRNKFFGNTVNPTLQGIGQNLGVNFTGNGGRIQNSRLGNELDRTLSQSSFNSSRDAIDKMYATALSRATQAGLTYDQSQAYARQMANDELKRSFQSEQKGKDIQAGLAQQDMNESYAKQGIAIQNQAQPKMDYESALTRSLFGLGGALGTGYLLNRTPKTQPQMPAYNPSTQNQNLYNERPNGYNG